MTDNNHSDGRESEDSGGAKERTRIVLELDDLDNVDRVVRDAIGRGKDVATGIGESIRESIRTVRSTRDSVVMVRVSKESLEKLEELVDAGVTNSRSEAAAFLISEGVKARADLYDKIAAQTEVIRKAREELKRLLDDDVNDDEPSPSDAAEGESS